MKLKNILLYLLPIAGYVVRAMMNGKMNSLHIIYHLKLPLTVMVCLESMYAIDLVMKRRHFSYQSL